MFDYPPPVDRLLRLGNPNLEEDWSNYRSLGLAAEHLTDLIRMATDAGLLMDLENSEGFDEETVDLLGWAPQHALRAVGQLEATEALGPLLGALETFCGMHDFWVQDFDIVMGRIGAVAIPACERYFDETEHDEYSRMTVAEVLGKIGEMHPELRDRCVAGLTARPKGHGPHDRAVSGVVVSQLIDLKAVESAAEIEAAFEADRIDPMMAGDWPEVRYQLGSARSPKLVDSSTTGWQGSVSAISSPSRIDRPSLSSKKNSVKTRNSSESRSNASGSGSEIAVLDPSTSREDRPGRKSTRHP